MKKLAMSKIFITSLVIFLIFFIESSIETSLISSSPCMNGVIVDGKWTTQNEWNDASKFIYERGKNILVIF